MDKSGFCDWRFRPWKISGLAHRRGENRHLGSYRRALRRVAPLRAVHQPHEEWYLESSSLDLYVYVRPEDIVSPKWIAPLSPTVEVNMETRDIRVEGLKLISTGEISSQAASAHLWILDRLAEEGQVAMISHSQASSVGKETWYRELTSDKVYRLVEGNGSGPFSWELLPPETKSRVIQ